ncbi:MAG: TVP38/TMEM64 family protein [Cyanobacteria bacterium P01_H01_bin.15]
MKFPLPSLRGATLLLLFTVSLSVVLWVGGEKLIDPHWFKTHLTHLDQQAMCCVEAAFVGIYVVLTIISLPATVLTIAGGAVFGLWWGFIMTVLGASLGALAAFGLARWFLHDAITNRWGKHRIICKCQTAIKKNPLGFVLTMRLMPISPFTLMNYVLGLTPISWKDYTVGTCVGIIPGSFAYTWLGVSGLRALEGGDRISFFLALSLLALLGILPWVWQKRCG